MSNGCAGEKKRGKFLLRLRGFITAAARNYYCSGLITRKSGKQLASGATSLVPVNLLPRLASRCRSQRHRLLLRQVFLAEIADWAVAANLLAASTDRCPV
jgi:hypothetical protein